MIDNNEEKLTWVAKICVLYTALQNKDTLDAVARYIKASIVHIGFEAVITVLYVAPFVLYSSAGSVQGVIPLSTFFGTVMLNSALIFAGVVLLYLFSLFLYISFSVTSKECHELDIEKHIERLSSFGIVIGALIYCAGGITVAYNPEWFAGTKPIVLSSQEMTHVSVQVTIIGLIWAVQSTMRYCRIAAIINQSPGDTLPIRIKNIATQVLVLCVVALFLLYSFKQIPTSIETFDYYNLILIIYFGIFSAYTSICYSLEINGKYPGEQ